MNTSDKTGPQNDADYVKKMKARYQEAYVRMLMEESVWVEEEKKDQTETDSSIGKAGLGDPE
jgi:hypothetical protein